MIKMQGTDIANKGGAPGAVVTVKCDYRAVSFAIGIVGIVYEVSRFGGARIATVPGLLSSGQKKGVWWIPADQYSLKLGCAFRRNSGGFRRNSDKRHRPEQNLTGTARNRHRNVL
jgi:hypothetical protein